MYQLIKLIKNLENELQELVGPESISLRISNNPNFDFQINNLVKFHLIIDHFWLPKIIYKWTQF